MFLNLGENKKKCLLSNPNHLNWGPLECGVNVNKLYIIQGIDETGQTNIYQCAQKVLNKLHLNSFSFQNMANQFLDPCRQHLCVLKIINVYLSIITVFLNVILMFSINNVRKSEENINFAAA